MGSSIRKGAESIVPTYDADSTDSPVDVDPVGAVVSIEILAAILIEPARHLCFVTALVCPRDGIVGRWRYVYTTGNVI